MAPPWLVGAAVWSEGARKDAVDATTCKPRGVRSIVVAMSLQQRVIVCHALDGSESEEAIFARFQVLLDDLQWEHDCLRAENVCIVNTQSNSPPFSKELGRLVQERGHHVISSPRGTVVDPELMEESLEKLLQPRAATQWSRAHDLLGKKGFEYCVRTLYSVAAAGETVFENPRMENAFHFSLQVHTHPVRRYMRMNATAQRMIQQALPPLIRPFCRTKRGLRCLLDRIDRPELDATVVHHRHELLHELVYSGDECETAIEELLGCVATAEPQLLLNSTNFSTLEDLRAFCSQSRQIQASCQVFFQVSSSAATRQLHAALAHQLTSIVEEVVMPFVKSVEMKISLFEATTAKADANGELCMQYLRGQVSACERSIQVHRDEMAASLLLQPERIKIVFEDSDFSSAASKALPVLFRVTRQDAHRVFKANALATDQITKKPRLAAETNTRVTLVYSRRTTGVWFSTPRLDALAVEWRTLHFEISRMETELVTSLVGAYDRDIRAPLMEWLALVPQLDVLAAFARISTQYGFTRAETMQTTHKMELVGLCWPQEVPSTTDVNTVLLDETHPLLVIHSAIGDDGSVPTRIAIAVVLHQIGCFVACSRATLPLVDALFVRAGARDHTLANESTFLSEMQQMSTILTRATPRSLVIIDELCRGTSPAEGLPLAVEMCRFLAEKRVFTCVSTQWTELLDALLKLDQATVPTAHTHHQDDDKQTYTRRLFDCDQRFVSALYDHDIPTELIELIESDLHDSTTAS